MHNFAYQLMKKMNNKKKISVPIIVAVVAVLAIIVAWLFFSEHKKTPQISDNISYEIPFNKQGTLTFLSAEGNDTISVIDIEIADNDQRRARGLMYRKSMPENAGMLFIHDRAEIQSFWMKNTYIPLDMIFVDSDNKIVTIHANTQPLREWSYASTEPALYVVEVNAGYCAKNKIAEGDKIEFQK